jgi:hypothetical protein
MTPRTRRHRSTRGRRVRAPAPALVLGALLALGGALLAAPPALDAAPQFSERDLGNLLCAPYALYCTQLWRRSLAREEPFNVLISETCLHVGYRENEDAGIACLEQGLRAAGDLPDSVLVAGQFAAGERERNAIWRDRSDREWARLTLAFLRGVPGYCDEATPVIFDYFPCLLQEVRYFQVVLKQVPPP